MLASLYMGYGMVVRTCAAAVASLCLCMYTDRASASGGSGVEKDQKARLDKTRQAAPFPFEFNCHDSSIQLFEQKPLCKPDQARPGKKNIE